MSFISPFLRGGLLAAALAFSFFSQKSFGQVLVSFSFTGSEQTWVVPSGINSIRIEAAGGGGGGGYNKLAGAGGGSTTVFRTSSGLSTVLLVAGGGGGGGGSGNTVYTQARGARGGDGAASGTAAGGNGGTGPDGDVIEGMTFRGAGGSGGGGGSPWAEFGVGTAGGDISFTDPSTGTVMFKAGGYGAAAAQFDQLGFFSNDGGTGGGGGGGAFPGTGGFAGYGYTGAGGGGGGGGSFSVDANAVYAPLGGVGDGGDIGGGDGGNGALVTSEFLVTPGDVLGLYVGGGGQSWTGLPDGGNGWVTISVPEPSSASLLLVGLVVGLARRRR